MRKTRAQKIKTAQRKAENKLKEEIAVLDDEIAKCDADIESYEKKDKRLENNKGLLKQTFSSFVALAIASFGILIGSTIFCMINDSNINKEADKIAATENYQGIKKELIEKYIAEYKNGEISSEELADKTAYLNTRVAPQEMCPSEKLEELKKHEKSGTNLIAASGGFTMFSLAVAGAATVGKIELDKRKRIAQRNIRYQQETKKPKLIRQKREKEEELAAIK